MIHALQNWLQHLYRIESDVLVENYLLDHAELMACFGKDKTWQAAEEVLAFCEVEGECHIGLYLAPSIFKSGQKVFSTHQIMTQIEGISHCLLLLDRFQKQRPISKLELELQAEIDKFLFFRLALPASQHEQAYYHLERQANLKTLDPKQQEQYQAARKLAYRYCQELESRYLSCHSWDPLLSELRDFYRMSHWKKIRAIRLG